MPGLRVEASPMSQHTEERQKVVTEERKFYVCDLCDCRIDGEPVKVAVNPEARVAVNGRAGSYIEAVATVDRPEDFVGMSVGASGSVVMEWEAAGDLCAFCAENLGLEARP